MGHLAALAWDIDFDTTVAFVKVRLVLALVSLCWVCVVILKDVHLFN